MAEIRILIYAIVGFFVGIYFFLKGFKCLKTKRLIENIPTSRIRSLAMGLTEIYGQVVPHISNILKSPFSNKNCVYYRFTIEEYRSSGKHSRWATTKKGEQGTLFYLKDKSGKVIVDMKGATVDIPLDNEFKSGMGKNPPKNVMKFLEYNKIRFEGIFKINKRMRFREYFIAPKDNLYIIGTAGDNPLIEDATSQMGVEDIMMQKGKNDKIFYISDKKESGVLKSFNEKVFFGVYGGAALSIMCLGVIFLYFGIF